MAKKREGEPTIDHQEVRARERALLLKLPPEAMEKLVGIPVPLSEVLSKEQIDLAKLGVIPDKSFCDPHSTREAIIFESGTDLDVPDGVYDAGGTYSSDSLIVVQGKKVINYFLLGADDGIFARKSGKDSMIYGAVVWEKSTNKDERIVSSGSIAQGLPRLEFKLPPNLKTESGDKK